MLIDFYLKITSVIHDKLYKYSLVKLHKLQITYLNVNYDNKWQIIFI